MPSSRTLISSQVLTGTAASVTFSAIPGTFKDLILKVSTRISVGAIDWPMSLRFNGDTATNYSNTNLYWSGPSSARFSNQTSATRVLGSTGNTATANTFGNIEIYIPSYTASQNKPLGSFGAPETNGTTFDDGTQAYAGLWRNTAAITSILISQDGSGFVSGSSFYLYGLAS
jgi:hypothetical protein